MVPGEAPRPVDFASWALEWRRRCSGETEAPCHRMTLTLRATCAGRPPAPRPGPVAPITSSGAVVHFDPQQSMAVRRRPGRRGLRRPPRGRRPRDPRHLHLPFFNDRLEPCKHLWAVALTCDAAVSCSHPTRSRPVDRLRRCSARRAPGRDWSSTTRSSGPLQTRPPAAPRRTARGPAWQQALTAITAAASHPRVAAELCRLASCSTSSISRVATGPAAADASAQAGAEAERRMGVPEPLGSAPGRTCRRCRRPDRTILDGSRARALLTRGHGAASVPDVPSPFHLRGVLARDLLPVICATGHCRLAFTQFPPHARRTRRCRS